MNLAFSRYILKRGRPAGRPQTSTVGYWRKVITWYKIEMAGRILGNGACSILKRGGNYNNYNNESEEYCRCIVNVSCYKRYSVYMCDS